MNFSSVSISELNSKSGAALNAANFGIVKMDHKGNVLDQNDNQGQHSGIGKSEVIGKHFFTQVAPCTNNFMVAQKYENEATLDVSLPYTMTIKMAPTQVKLRLLKDASAQYMLCDWS